MLGHNLNSQEWIDIVFEGKNKEYGAYPMRRASGMRNLQAVGFIFGFSAILVLSFVIINVSFSYTSFKQHQSVTEVSNLRPVQQKTAEKKKKTKSIDSRLAMRKGVEGARPMTEAEAMKISDQPTKGTGPVVIGTENVGEQAVSSGTAVTKTETPDTQADAQDGIKVAEKLPEYPGGMVELMKWLNKNLVYPPTDLQKKREGKVTVRFIVNKDGSISNIKLISTGSAEMNQEVMRLMNAMPKWKPGIADDKPCRTMMVIPIVFKI